MPHHEGPHVRAGGLAKRKREKKEASCGPEPLEQFAQERPSKAGGAI